jgi:N-acetylmuramoyl-L-alanine amidase
VAIKIFIDQGHNPQNPNSGAEGNGLREQDITYAVGVALADLLREDSRFDVLLSRNSPSEILGTSNSESLRLRVEAANNYGADAFISIHVNASDIISATGSEGYVFSRNSNAFELAEDITEKLTEATGYQDRGVFVRPSLYVLRKTSMPFVLVELGFITNPGEAEFMNNNPGLYARGIYNGFLDYYGFE